LRRPVMKPSAGLPGVEGVLVVISSPVPSSSATTSVNSPGVDADPDPSLSLVRHVVDSTGRGQAIRCQFVPTEAGSAVQPFHPSCVTNPLSASLRTTR